MGATTASGFWMPAAFLSAARLPGFKPGRWNFNWIPDLLLMMGFDFYHAQQNPDGSGRWASCKA
jgi:hypothetical protein